MKQINPQLLFLSFFMIIMISISCDKKDIYIDLTANKWEVVKIRKQGESAYTNTEKSYIVKFTNEQTYSTHLDVNDCFGEYEITSNGNITVGQMGCTEVCCDSAFATTLSDLFPKMTSYFGKDDELIFEGEGKIILKKK